jgi:hypothetical protein
MQANPPAFRIISHWRMKRVEGKNNLCSPERRESRG